MKSLRMDTIIEIYEGLLQNRPFVATETYSISFFYEIALSHTYILYLSICFLYNGQARRWYMYGY